MIDATSLQPSRRTVLKGAAVTAAAVATAGSFRAFDVAAAAAPSHKGVFGYGVASGDPTGDAVIIWTRATPPRRSPKDPVAGPGSGLGKALTVRWEISHDEHFRDVVKRGIVRTSPASDHTVKIDVTGLSPYTQYFYRFTAEGETSPVGRTQTAPDEKHRIHALRFALVTCSNYTGGYFTAYRVIADGTTSTSCCMSATTSTNTRTRPAGRTGVTARPRWSASVMPSLTANC